jgi:hypothetical protein
MHKLIKEYCSGKEEEIKVVKKETKEAMVIKEE